MEYDTSNFFCGLALGGALVLAPGITAVIIGGIGVRGCNDQSYCPKTIDVQPGTDDVQSGYVVPSRLEVELIDLDGNGKLETTLKYDGRRYLLLQSEQGEVSLKMYNPK